VHGFACCAQYTRRYRYYQSLQSLSLRIIISGVAGIQQVQRPEADLGIPSMFVHPRKEGSTGQRKCQIAARHFLACWDLFMACCNI